MMKTFTNIKKWLFKQRAFVVTLVIFYPYLVGYSPIDSSNSKTTVDFLLGTGKHSYASYDCSGNLTELRNHSTIDYGASVKYEYKKLKVGVRGGGYSVKLKDVENNYLQNYNYYFETINYDSLYSQNNVYYVNPFIGFGNQYFEFNAGVIVFGNLNYNSNLSNYLIGEGGVSPTLYIRIGNYEKFHYTAQYLSNTPLFSGGGILDAGFSFPLPDSRSMTYVGASWGPYQNLGLSVKQNIQLSKSMDLLLRGRAGLLESNFEGGISAGLRLVF